MAYQYPALALPFDIYHGPYAYDILLLQEFLRLHLDRIRHFLLVVEQYFLAYYLIDEKTLRFVGQRIFRIIGRTFRKRFHNTRQEVFHTEFFQRRQREYFRYGQPPVPVRNRFLKRLLVYRIYLVYYQKHRHLRIFYLAVKSIVFEVFHSRLDHVQQHVGIVERLFHETHHRLLKFVCRLYYPRSIRKHYLAIIAADYTQYPVPRSLGFGCDYRQLASHKGVHQRRFAYIRIAYDIDKTRFMLVFFLFHNGKVTNFYPYAISGPVFISRLQTPLPP